MKVLTRADRRNGHRPVAALLTLNHYFLCQGLDNIRVFLSTNMHDGLTWEASWWGCEDLPACYLSCRLYVTYCMSRFHYITHLSSFFSSVIWHIKKKSLKKVAICAFLTIFYKRVQLSVCSVLSRYKTQSNLCNFVLKNTFYVCIQMHFFSSFKHT